MRKRLRAILIRQAVQMIFRQYFPTTDFKQVIDWFEMGGNLKFSDTEAAASVLTRLEHVQGLLEKTEAARRAGGELRHGLRAAAGEMILEGLHSIDKISRSEERGFSASERSKGAGAGVCIATTRWSETGIRSR